MHRPALPRRHPAWAHPYPPGLFSAVFYNSGGAPPAGGGGNPPAPPAPPPAPAPGSPPPPAPGTPPVDPPKPGPPGGKTFTQDEVNQIAASEKDQGRRAGRSEALKALADKYGLTDAEALDKYIEQAQAADRAQMTEQERKAQELADREAKLAQKEAAAAAAQRTAERRSVLVGLGATGANLDDAALLLQVGVDADTAAVQEAASKLKERRPELFGVTPPPGGTPPAPGGAPAGGGAPPRQQPAGKPGDRGRAMARSRGHATKDPAA